MPASGEGERQARHHDIVERQIPLGLGQVAALAGTDDGERGQRGLHSLDHRHEELDQSPDRGHADRSGADQPDIVAEQAGGVGRSIHAGFGGVKMGQDRHRHAPGDQNPDEHRDADDDADQIAGADQRQRHAGADTGRDPAQPEEDADLGGEDREAAADERESGRNHAAGHDVRQPWFARRRRGAIGRAADLEDFRGGDTFGIRQIAFDHHGAAQRHGEHHPQYAAQRADTRGLPEGKAGPVADHHQAGQHEDDRGQRTRRRSQRLDDVVLEDVRALDQPQHRHRDHGGGNGGGEGQTDFQPQIDIRGGEDDGDQGAKNDAPQGEFTHRLLQSALRGQK